MAAGLGGRASIRGTCGGAIEPSAPRFARRACSDRMTVPVGRGLWSSGGISSRRQKSVRHLRFKLGHFYDNLPKSASPEMSERLWDSIEGITGVNDRLDGFSVNNADEIFERAAVTH